MRKFSEITEEEKILYSVKALAEEEVKSAVDMLIAIGMTPDNNEIMLLNIAGKMLTDWTKEIEP